jgi:hypothetical protein
VTVGKKNQKIHTVKNAKKFKYCTPFVTVERFSNQNTNKQRGRERERERRWRH